jgi:hypothetical protein
MKARVIQESSQRNVFYFSISQTVTVTASNRLWTYSTLLMLLYRMFSNNYKTDGSRYEGDFQKKP